MIENVMIEKTKRLIAEINRIHLQFSMDYHDSGVIDKVNLSRTIANVPTNYIYKYRLYLHESINDYLMAANIADVSYFYRVKTRESIDDKIKRYAEHEDQYPVNNWLNDIFGARIILRGDDVARVLTLLDGWQDEFGLKNWYVRDKEGYKGIHIYFKNKSNYFFPWELQVWDEKDVAANIASHRAYKRGFLSDEG